MEELLWTRLFANDSVSCVVVSNRREILERADKIVIYNGIGQNVEMLSLENNITILVDILKSLQY